MGFTSVAYPVDELRLPQWFKDLPFDDAEMESTIIDNKLDNLIGVLEWDLSKTEEKTTFNKLRDTEMCSSFFLYTSQPYQCPIYSQP